MYYITMLIIYIYIIYIYSTARVGLFPLFPGSKAMGHLPAASCAQHGYAASPEHCGD